MKHLKTVLVIVCGLLLTAAAFASDKNSVNLTLNNKTTVSGTTLEPGEYKILFDRDGDNVQARFVSHGKTVATTSGHFEQRASFPSSVSLVVNNNDRVVQQILVEKLKGAVVLEGAGSSATGH